MSRKGKPRHWTWDHVTTHPEWNRTAPTTSSLYGTHPKVLCTACLTHVLAEEQNRDEQLVAVGTIAREAARTVDQIAAVCK